MTNKYHRQGFVSAGLVTRLLTSKADKADTLLKLVRETRRMLKSDKFKFPKFKLKTKKETKDTKHKIIERIVVSFLNFKNSIFVFFLTNFKVFIIFSNS